MNNRGWTRTYFFTSTSLPALVYDSFEDEINSSTGNELADLCWSCSSKFDVTHRLALVRLLNDNTGKFDIQEGEKNLPGNQGNKIVSIVALFSTS